MKPKTSEEDILKTITNMKEIWNKFEEIRCDSLRKGFELISPFYYGGIQQEYNNSLNKLRLELSKLRGE